MSFSFFYSVIFFPVKPKVRITIRTKAASSQYQEVGNWMIKICNVEYFKISYERNTLKETQPKGYYIWTRTDLNNSSIKMAFCVVWVLHSPEALYHSVTPWYWLLAAFARIVTSRFGFTGKKITPKEKYIIYTQIVYIWKLFHLHQHQ